MRYVQTGWAQKQGSRGCPVLLLQRQSIVKQRLYAEHITSVNTSLADYTNVGSNMGKGAIICSF
jgi:hypothetical protein